MRTILKGEAPACLDSAEKKGWSWEEFVTNDHEGYQMCREQANFEQQSVCAYTELPLDVARVTVHFDHYRKKSIYTKLRFKWDNLFAAVKDNRFGADHKDGIVNGSNHNQVYASILSPLTANLQEYFHYSTSGEIEPSLSLSEENQKKAEETIRVFNLNEAELVERRRTIMAQIVCYQDLPEEDIKSSFDGLGFPSVVDQEVRYMLAQ